MDRRFILQSFGYAFGATFVSRVCAAAEEGALHSKFVASKLISAQQAIVVRAAELILPRTETPGAIEAGVPAFIDHIVSDWYSERERKIFVDGLGALQAFTMQRHGRAFVEASVAQQTEALEAMEAQSATYAPPPGASVFGSPDEASPFFFKLKLLTVLGYYTSEIGGTTELAFDPAPSRYDGDVEFAKLGKQWSS